MNLIKVKYKMGTIIINSKDIKISDPHPLLLNLSDKTN